MSDADDAPPPREPGAPFLQEVEPERLRMPLQPGSHGPVAEMYRQKTLGALHAMSEQIDALSDAVRAIPDDDAVADQFIARMLSVQNTAGAFLERFRNSRDAQGQA